MSLLFSVFKSNHYHPNKIIKNVIGLFSVISPTMFRQCLQFVSTETTVGAKEILNKLPTNRILTLEANHIVTSGSLRKGCFVRLKSFQANSVKGKKSVMSILKLAAR